MTKVFQNGYFPGNVTGYIYKRRRICRRFSPICRPTSFQKQQRLNSFFCKPFESILDYFDNFNYQARFKVHTVRYHSEFSVLQRLKDFLIRCRFLAPKEASQLKKTLCWQPIIAPTPPPDFLQRLPSHQFQRNTVARGVTSTNELIDFLRFRMVQ